MKTFLQEDIWDFAVETIDEVPGAIPCIVGFIMKKQQKRSESGNDSPAVEAFKARCD
jgi:hypothetical protein